MRPYVPTPKAEGATASSSDGPETLAPSQGGRVLPQEKLREVRAILITTQKHRPALVVVVVAVAVVHVSSTGRHQSTIATNIYREVILVNTPHYARLGYHARLVM